MLLRRVIQHVKDQNWTAVAIDFEAMARDQAFLNDFIDNVRRYDAYVTNVTGRQSEVIKSLGVAIASGSRPTSPPRAAESELPSSHTTDLEELAEG